MMFTLIDNWPLMSISFAVPLLFFWDGKRTKQKSKGTRYFIGFIVFCAVSLILLRFLCYGLL
jgi:hypothetical protein